MRKKIACLVLLSAAVVAMTLSYSRTLMATQAQGFQSTTLAQGRLGDIDVFNRFVYQSFGQKTWESLQKTKGDSDLYVQSNVWQPGGTTGWHTHLGHSLIIVTAGTITEYEGNDPNCTPHVYTKGMSFVDSGGGHVHIIRDEGDVEAQAIAVQLIPAGQARRIDAKDPGNCPF